MKLHFKEQAFQLLAVKVAIRLAQWTKTGQ